MALLFGRQVTQFHLYYPGGPFVARKTCDCGGSQTGARMACYPSITPLLFAQADGMFDRMGGCFFFLGYTPEAIGYQNGDETTPEVMNGLRITFADLPCLLLLAAIVVFSFFPMAKDLYDRMVDRIRERNFLSIITDMFSE